jgi:hypothetical protein
VTVVVDPSRDSLRQGEPGEATDKAGAAGYDAIGRHGSEYARWATTPSFQYTLMTLTRHLADHCPGAYAAVPWEWLLLYPSLPHNRCRVGRVVL